MANFCRDLFRIRDDVLVDVLQVSDLPEEDRQRLRQGLQRPLEGEGGPRELQHQWSEKTYVAFFESAFFENAFFENAFFMIPDGHQAAGRSP